MLGILAAGSFLVISVSAFRLDPPTDTHRRSAGTGGFAMYGTSAMPIFRDLNTPLGRRAYGLTAEQMQGVAVVAMRVRDGDDASCLNLNQAQTPRLLGVRPTELQNRQAFTFVATEEIGNTEDPWSLLSATLSAGEVPAIGDEATIVWALGKGLGQTIDYIDDRGRPFTVRVVGMLGNSILQGSVIISEEHFISLFASSQGYRDFLIDVPASRVDQVTTALTKALRHEGMAISSADKRLAEFNIVQNTYLNIFQIAHRVTFLLI